MGLGVRDHCPRAYSKPSTFSDERWTEFGDITGLSSPDRSFSAWHASCLNHD